ncbi:MAG: carboxypeptidase-like regulatory domain-containing protein, partial [Candidatus Kapaibacterium sp.]
MSKNRLSLHRSLFVMLALLLIGGATAMAKTPRTPLGLRGWLINDSSGRVQLTWVNGDSLTPKGGNYNVYQANGTDSLHPTYAKVATVADSNGMGYYSATLAEGTYSFYVKAVSGNQESPASNVTTVRVFKQVLSFTSSPVDSTPGGVDYQFQFHAVSSRKGDVIQYRLSNPEAGMTIDAATGLFHWHPYTVGSFNIYVVAYLQNDKAVQLERSLYLTVLSTPAMTCVTFYGRVLYADNQTPPNGGFVYAMPLDSADGQPAGMGHIDSRGNYRFTGPAGTYRIVAGASPDFDVTYLGGSGMTYKVGCGDSVLGNFSVTRKPVQHLVDSIMGQVRRASDGMPATATIHFTSLDSFALHNYDVTTDSNGHYSILIDAPALYMVQAVPLSGALLSQYYDHAATAAQATPFRAGGGAIHTLNFDLPANVVYNNTISGTLISKNNNLLSGIITAYSITNGRIADAGQMGAPNGSFSFTNLTPGTYVLFAAAYDSSSVPGYYRQNHKAERSWQDGTQLTVTATSMTTGIEIKLDEENGHHGASHLRGSVSEGGGRAKRDDAGLQGTKPLAGALVYAVDDQSTVSGYAITNAAGTFQIDNLADGIYTVQVDKIGFTGTIQTIEVGTKTQDVNAILTAAEGISGAPMEAVTGTSFMALPNPARDQVTLSFTAGNGSARLMLVNASGDEVLARNIETVNGTNI